MRFTIFFICLFSCANVFAQQIHSYSLVDTVNQKNPDIVEISRLRSEYLMSSLTVFMTIHIGAGLQKKSTRAMISFGQRGILNYTDWPAMEACRIWSCQSSRLIRIAMIYILRTTGAALRNIHIYCAPLTYWHSGRMAYSC